MKKHLISLLNPEYRVRTILFFVLSVLLTGASQIIGITDNLPGIALLLSGMMCLFFAVLHPWNNPTKFAILTIVSFGLVGLTFGLIYLAMLVHLTEYISEGLVMGFIGLFCLPGILAGFIGAIFWVIRRS